MTKGLHPSADDLSALMRGVFDEQRTEELLDHVEGCEPCFVAAEALWRGSSRHQLSVLAVPEPEGLSTLERQLLRRLHATELGEQAMRLASSGFLYVGIRLMEPILYFMSGRPAGRRLP